MEAQIHTRPAFWETCATGWKRRPKFTVAVLLALLFLGVKGIRLGPTLPAFLSPTVAGVLVDKFDIKPIGTVADDVAAMMAGK